jgi:predicted Zn-dependent protease
MFSTQTEKVEGGSLPLDKETRQLFFQLGSTALNNLLGTHAAALFGALEVAEPDQAYPKVGLGMTYLCCSEFDTAAEYFNQEVVQNSSLAPSANALLAMSCKLDNNHSGFASASAKAVEGNAEFQSTVEDLKAVSV